MNEEGIRVVKQQAIETQQMAIEISKKKSKL